MMAIRVLLADDSAATARAVLAALPEPEFEVRVADEGGRAARAVLELKPDAVLAALGLPGRNGAELGALLRQAPDGKTAALIFLQGVVEPLDVARLAGLDHDGVVRKPFESAALADLVRRAVEKRREIPFLPEEPALNAPTPARPEPSAPTLGLEDTPMEQTLRRLVRDELARTPWEGRMREIAAEEYRKRMVRELKRGESGKKK